MAGVEPCRRRKYLGVVGVGDHYRCQRELGSSALRCSQSPGWPPDCARGRVGGEVDATGLGGLLARRCRRSAFSRPRSLYSGAHTATRLAAPGVGCSRITGAEGDVAVPVEEPRHAAQGVVVGDLDVGVGFEGACHLLKSDLPISDRALQSVTRAAIHFLHFARNAVAHRAHRATGVVGGGRSGR